PLVMPQRSQGAKTRRLHARSRTKSVDVRSRNFRHVGMSARQPWVIGRRQRRQNIAAPLCIQTPAERWTGTSSYHIPLFPPMLTGVRARRDIGAELAVLFPALGFAPAMRTSSAPAA